MRAPDFRNFIGRFKTILGMYILVVGAGVAMEQILKFIVYRTALKTGVQYSIEIEISPWIPTIAMLMIVVAIEIIRTPRALKAAGFPPYIRSEELKSNAQWRQPESGGYIRSIILTERAPTVASAELQLPQRVASEFLWHWEHPKLARLFSRRAIALKAYFIVILLIITIITAITIIPALSIALSMSYFDYLTIIIIAIIIAYVGYRLLQRPVAVLEKRLYNKVRSLRMMGYEALSWKEWGTNPEKFKGLLIEAAGSVSEIYTTKGSLEFRLSTARIEEQLWIAPIYVICKPDLAKIDLFDIVRVRGIGAGAKIITVRSKPTRLPVLKAISAEILLKFASSSELKGFSDKRDQRTGPE